MLVTTSKQSANHMATTQSIGQSISKTADLLGFLCTANSWVTENIISRERQKYRLIFNFFGWPERSEENSQTGLEWYKCNSSSNDHLLQPSYPLWTYTYMKLEAEGQNSRTPNWVLISSTKDWKLKLRFTAWICPDFYEQFRLLVVVK